METPDLVPKRNACCSQFRTTSGPRVFSVSVMGIVGRQESHTVDDVRKVPSGIWGPGVESIQILTVAGSKSNPATQAAIPTMTTAMPGV